MLMEQMHIQELKEIENRLDFLNTLAENDPEVSPFDIEREIDSIIITLKKAHKNARINEIGLKLVSL